MFDVEVPAAILAILLIVTLQGCGHKGPLMLPPSKVPAPQAPAASQPSVVAPLPDTSSPQPAKQP